MTSPAPTDRAAPGPKTAVKPAEHWRQRLIRTLLYGQNVDRAAKAKARVGLAMLAFGGVYGVIALRLVVFAVNGDAHSERRASHDAVATARPDIVDRNGEILATDVKSPSLFSEPRRIIDKDEAVELLTGALPDLDDKEVRERLSTRKGFAWLKREITPAQQRDIHKLGIPGIGFLTENKRTYPSGPEVSHVIGLTNIDNQGIAGIEKWLDTNGLADLHQAGLASDRQQEPVELALDLRVEHALRDELLKAKAKFSAKAASGIVSNVRTGEIVAMVSLPDFDPNDPKEVHDPDRINHLTTGVYEMGSTFKSFTLAMAIDSGKYDLNSQWDDRTVMHFGRFTIHDDELQRRFISMKEVFRYSSNIGAARIALAMGVDAHKAFLRKMGQMDRLRTELPESASPIVPKHWGDLNTITISFGHGIAVAPLQAVMGVDALVNGGYLIPPTFLKRSEAEAMATAKKVIKTSTSDRMRYLLRFNAEVGTAKKADQLAKGYDIGGKTGTAEKVINGHYAKKRVLTDFMAIFPADHPQYQVLVMLDEPQALKETYGFITAGWNAAPTGGNVVARVAPLLGVEPRTNVPPSDSMTLASMKTDQ